MINLYRLEHKETGKGPWTADTPKGWPIGIYESHKKIGLHPSEHPGPLQDIGNRLPDNYIYGCQSLEQLSLWFPCEKGRNSLSPWFNIMHYEVDRRYCKIGSMQIAFIKKMALHKMTYSILDFKKLMKHEIEK